MFIGVLVYNGGIMGYRIKEHRKPQPRRTLVDTTSPAKVYVHNGTIAHLAFPCWYQEVHKPAPVHHHAKHRHDHEGWPEPSHPDHVCQLWTPSLHCCSLGLHHECGPHCRHYISMAGIHPIHLSDEGYNQAYVTFNASEELPDSVTVNAQIDDYVVRVTIDTLELAALYEPAIYKMTVFVEAPAGNLGPARRDIVALTDLVILPSGYKENVS